MYKHPFAPFPPTSEWCEELQCCLVGVFLVPFSQLTELYTFHLLPIWILMIRNYLSPRPLEDVVPLTQWSGSQAVLRTVILGLSGLHTTEPLCP